MIAAVLDANTIVSGVLVEHGIPRRLLRAAYARRFACVSSAAIVTEVMRTFSRERVTRKYRIERADVERLRGFLESDEVATLIAAPVSGVATHPEDDLILATAVSGNAVYLVTGDRQLPQLGNSRGVRIVSPREFLQLLEAEPEQ